MDDTGFIDLGAPIPIFPLPNSVLFPQVALRLHVFEPRYRALTRDALAGQQAIATALLRDGWENDYQGNPPIHPTVCVGRIVASRTLDDGRYDLVLVGICRAQVAVEDKTGPYRKGVLQQVGSREDASSPVQGRLKLEMGEALNHPAFRQLHDISDLKQLAAGELPAGGIADVLAHRLLPDAAIKQQLLEELDVEIRVERLVDELHTLGKVLEAARTEYRWAPQSGPDLN